MRKPSSGLVALALAGSLAGCSGQDGSSDVGVKTDVGVTKEPCPGAVDKRLGCIYLGVISDLTGPLSALGGPAAEAATAFWTRVNANGGIGGKFEVDITSYVKDNKYSPKIHNAVYQDIKPHVLALAQTVGAPTTATILPDLKANSVVAVPGSFTSGWLFEDVMLEAGPSYCIEAMNDVDYARQAMAAKRLAVVHFPGDYGDDAAGGVRYAAEQAGLPVTDIVTGPGKDKQARAVTAALAARPDVVILATGPAEAAAIVGGAVARGYPGKFIGLGPTWVPELSASPAGAALARRYLQSAEVQPWNTDTTGHGAMRDALGSLVSVTDAYTAGWVAAYPLKAALEQAVADGDLTRAGLLAAGKSLTRVNFEGMLPGDAGNQAGGPAAAVRETVINKPDPESPTGVSMVEPRYIGAAARGFVPEQPCYLDRK